MGRDLAIFLSGYGSGGVEKMLVRLALGLARDCGVSVDFLAPAGERPYLDRLDGQVSVIRLDRGDLYQQLGNYLRAAHPRCLLTGKPPDEALAVRVRRTIAEPPLLYCRIGVPQLHRERQRSRNPLRYWWLRRQLAENYRHVDGFLVVSRAIADELTGALRVAAHRVHVLPNPVIDEDVLTAAELPCPHRWLDEIDGPPVILGVGAFRRQKDFPTLIRAFAELRSRQPARLIILGEGRQRSRLQRLVARLGVANDVDLPGFSVNPYAYMRRAALFALSSRWEGQPNVLIEAMGLGTPVVATDCVSGPREILDGGRFGELTVAGDASALAAAMARTLAAPLSPDTLRSAVGDYTLTASTGAYARVLGLADSGFGLVWGSG